MSLIEHFVLEVSKHFVVTSDLMCIDASLHTTFRPSGLNRQVSTLDNGMNAAVRILRRRKTWSQSSASSTRIGCPEWTQCQKTTTQIRSLLICFFDSASFGVLASAEATEAPESCNSRARKKSSDNHVPFIPFCCHWLWANQRSVYYVPF